MSTTMIIGIIVLLLIVAALWYWFKKAPSGELRIHRLPLHELGYKDIPAVPLDLRELPKTLLDLNTRAKETQQAKNALTTIYTVEGNTANSYSFLFGKSEHEDAKNERDKLHKELENSSLQEMLKPHNTKKHLNRLSHKATPLNKTELNHLALDKPEQFSMMWTSYFNVHKNNVEKYQKKWASSLTSADAASEQFWPMIAEYGLAYNLLILEKLSNNGAKSAKAKFQEKWTRQMEDWHSKGLVYAIDMTIFKTTKANKIDGFDRLTPSTYTYLVQDPDTKALTPFAVVVAGENGVGEEIFVRGRCTDSTWLYALQAAKVSITVYGIWLGHVYQWHIVSAAMQMTFHNNIPSDHPLGQLLEPRMKYLMAFDNALLLLWKQAGPPTSIGTSEEFIALCNEYAKGRKFTDDEPKVALKKQGLDPEKFKRGNQAWGAYPLVGNMLDIWDISEEYIRTFVEETYPSNQSVKEDAQLQAWMKASSDPEEGNVMGIPTIDSKKALVGMLTNLIYRLSTHGTSRLERTANPALSFLSNFPPCLQNANIPSPDMELSTKDILEYLPRTGTMGGMITFYYTFIFSAPYESLIPIEGVEEKLHFPDGLKDKRNQALVKYRTQYAKFIQSYDPVSPTVHQVPANIET